MKIISGGQTGADRGGLDAAIETGFEHGGRCPKGRKAEDGCIPSRYHLIETETDDYRQRTELNVKDSDATLIFIKGTRPTGGSRLTVKCCEKHNKPFLVVNVFDRRPPILDRVEEFLVEHKPAVVNVAGSGACDSSDVSCSHGVVDA